MKLQIFAVYDAKAKAFAHPFYAPNRDVAVRHFANGANDPTLQLATNSEDFTLHHLGEWDDGDASFTLNVAPVQLALALNLKRPTT